MNLIFFQLPFGTLKVFMPMPAGTFYDIDRVLERRYRQMQATNAWRQRISVSWTALVTWEQHFIHRPVAHAHIKTHDLHRHVRK